MEVTCFSVQRHSMRLNHGCAADISLDWMLWDKYASLRQILPKSNHNHSFIHPSISSPPTPGSCALPSVATQLQFQPSLQRLLVKKRGNGFYLSLSSSLDVSVIAAAVGSCLEECCHFSLPEFSYNRMTCYVHSSSFSTEHTFINPIAKISQASSCQTPFCCIHSVLLLCSHH